jgi:hypothetical protein
MFIFLSLSIVLFIIFVSVSFSPLYISTPAPSTLLKALGLSSPVSDVFQIFSAKNVKYFCLNNFVVWPELSCIFSVLLSKPLYASFYNFFTIAVPAGKA